MPNNARVRWNDVHKSNAIIMFVCTVNAIVDMICYYNCLQFKASNSTLCPNRNWIIVTICNYIFVEWASQVCLRNREISYHMYNVHTILPQRNQRLETWSCHFYHEGILLTHRHTIHTVHKWQTFIISGENDKWMIRIWFMCLTTTGFACAAQGRCGRCVVSCDR